MKYSKLTLLVIILVSLTTDFTFLTAQDEKELDPMRFYRARYEEFYQAPFDTVVQAVRESIEELNNCTVIQDIDKTDRDGYLKAIIKSDFCVFSEGDSTFDLLQKYSKNMPFIRGGTWKNGRLQYKFVINETPEGKTKLLLKGSLSGFENNITYKVHFWESNGQLEHNMLLAIAEKIKRKIGKE